MLNIGKLAAGAGEYYAREVASSAEDYDAGRGETAGRWVGPSHRSWVWRVWATLNTSIASVAGHRGVRVRHGSGTRSASDVEAAGVHDTVRAAS